MQETESDFHWSQAMYSRVDILGVEMLLKNTPPLFIYCLSGNISTGIRSREVNRTNELKGRRP
jgi:hypothetical protein